MLRPLKKKFIGADRLFARTTEALVKNLNQIPGCVAISRGHRFVASYDHSPRHYPVFSFPMLSQWRLSSIELPSHPCCSVMPVKIITEKKEIECLLLHVSGLQLF
jgi:hypothetical protein